MREVRDSARHAEIVEGRSGPVSDLCWRYLGVVKADENEAGHLLGTFEFQPSLVGTRSPNREGVIGVSLVIGSCLRFESTSAPRTLTCSSTFAGPQHEDRVPMGTGLQWKTHSSSQTSRSYPCQRRVTNLETLSALDQKLGSQTCRIGSGSRRTAVGDSPRAVETQPGGVLRYRRRGG